MAKRKLAGTGGSIERDLVRRKIRRLLKDDAWAVYPVARDLLRYLLDWLDTQPTRTAKPGGIGKR